MNKNTKIIILVAAIVILVLVVVLLVVNITGSFKKPNANAAPTEAIGEATLPPTPPAVITPTPTPSPDPTPTGVLVVEDDVIEVKDDTITYEYYDVVSDQKKSETVKTDGTATLRTILDTVSQSILGTKLEDGYINPNSVTMVGDSVYVDLKSSVYEAPLGSSGEVSLLNAIHDGYVNNVPGITKVYISVDGSDYSSGNMKFTKNKPYTP